MILVVDPGIRGCGVALFSLEKKLVACAYVKNPLKTGNGIAEVLSVAKASRDWAYCNLCEFDFSHFVGEWPQIYTASKSKGDNNDLLPLVGVVCSIATTLSVPVTQYFPREWKSQLTKEATLERVCDRLDITEMSILGAAMRDAGKSLAHNVVDAAAIGLHYSGRFTPRKVYPR